MVELQCRARSAHYGPQNRDFAVVWQGPLIEVWRNHVRRFERDWRHPALDGAVNKRFLSTGETGEFASENVGFGLNPMVECAPRMNSLPTGENTRRVRTRGMLGIRARGTAGAAVNKMSASSWGAKVLAPRHGFEPRFTAPKAAVLPLDDRGKWTRSKNCHFSVALHHGLLQRSAIIAVEANLGRCRARASNPLCGAHVSRVGSTPTGFRHGTRGARPSPHSVESAGSIWKLKRTRPRISTPRTIPPPEIISSPIILLILSGTRTPQRSLRRARPAGRRRHSAGNLRPHSFLPQALPLLLFQGLHRQRFGRDRHLPGRRGSGA